jgi:hypothetical protein
MATTTLSQRSNLDHTADDFTIGQRVKAHPATDTFMGCVRDYRPY